MRRNIVSLVVAGTLALSGLVWAGAAQAADTASISGTVILPEGYSWAGDSSNGSVRLFTTTDNPPYMEDVANSRINSDGTYIFTGLVPGQAYVVCVPPVIDTDPASGLLLTCHGGYSTNGNIWRLDSTCDGVEPIVAPADGSESTGNDITVKKGTLLTGQVTGPDSPSSVLVEACIVEGSVGDRYEGDCTSTYPADDGNYSITLEPGKDYVVYADGTVVAEGYLITYLGGYADMADPDLNDSSLPITILPSPVGGGSLNANIDMVKGTIVRGTITLEESGSGVTVYVCQVDTTGSGKALSACRSRGFMSILWGDSTQTHIGYIFTVPSGIEVVVRAQVSGYLDTWYGGYAGSGTPDLSDPSQVTVTTTDGETLVADITMVRAGRISGTISVPDGYTWLSTSGNGNGYVQAYEVEQNSDGTYTIVNSMSNNILNYDGTYTITGLEPGRQYAICASAYSNRTDPAGGLLTTCRGGFATTRSYLYSTTVDSSKLDLVTVPASGGSLTGVDFTLARGSVITGTVSGPPADSLSNVYMTACPVRYDPNSNWWNQGSCSYAYADGNGKYSITAENGSTYVVYAQVSGYLPTYVGQYSVSRAFPGSDASQETVTKLEAPEEGGTLTGDIDLVKGTVISGTLTVPGLSWNNSASGWVYVCQVVTRGSDRYYTDCNSTWVQSYNNWDYSVTVPNGADYVVYAVVDNAPGDGYLYTYHGGYATDYTNSTNDLKQSGVKVLTSPPGGADLTADITMARAASISGMVKLPEGYSFVSDSYGYVNVYRPPVEDATYWNYSSTNINLNNGTYKMTGLMPGKSYVVCVTTGNIRTNPASGLLSTCHDGYATDRQWIDSNFDSLGVGKVTTPQTGGNLPDVNIDMQLGASITGTVYLPDGSPASGAYVYLYQLAPDGEDDYVYAISIMAGADGKYSFTVAPGVPYVVNATLDGYPRAWHGGYTGYPESLYDPKVTQLTADTNGQVLSGKDIQFVEGSTITGTLRNYVPAANGYVYVEACYTNAEGRIIDCGYTNAVDSEGRYSISGLVPNAQYVVHASGTGYVLSYHGGLVGNLPLPNDKATPVTAAEAGGTVPDIDITMVRPLTITGKVLPPELVSGGVDVFICPVYTENGQDHYINSPGWDHGIAPLASGVDVFASSTEVNQYCSYAWADANNDWTYTAEVTPDQKYVVIGRASDMADAWHGGYIADSDVARVEVGTVSPLPNSNLITTVTGQAGGKLENVNLVFGESVTVTFDATGGTPATQTRSVVPGGTVTLPSEPTKTGYQFLGWFANPDGSGDQFSGGAITADRTVYAKWQQAEVTYTLSYNANQGSGSMTGGSYAENSSVAAKANGFTRSGYTFTGWNTAADGSGTAYAAGASVTMTADVTLYAQWQQNPKPVFYTLSYDANLGSGSMTGGTYTSGMKVTAKANGFTRSGYTFTGWNTAADGSGTAYAANAEVTMDRSLTLYAQWQKDSEVVEPLPPVDPPLEPPVDPDPVVPVEPVPPAPDGSTVVAPGGGIVAAGAQSVVLSLVLAGLLTVVGLIALRRRA